MKRTMVRLALSGILIALAAGCASSNQAAYVDPAGTHTISNVGEINQQDWNTASEAMINSLIEKQIKVGNLKATGPDGKSG